MTLNAPERALLAARRAEQALRADRARDAAWLALQAVELDPDGGLAWSQLARMVLEVTRDPMGTLATRAALELGIGPPERAAVERYHRIDLWMRGLLAHHEERALLPVGAFDDERAFVLTPRHQPWLEQHQQDWRDTATLLAATARMVAALSDAWVVPDTPDDVDPLLVDEGWTPTTDFGAWLRRHGLEGATEDDAREAEAEAAVLVAETDPALEVLSDYWIEQEIVRLGASGGFELALERARLWGRLRPQSLKARAVLLRVLAAGGWDTEREAMTAELLALKSDDLNELEEARLALGELRQWEAQLAILDRMSELAPDNPVILGNRGVAKLELGDGAGGEADLEAALEADADYGPALANLALVRMRAERYVAARELLERAIKVAPTQPDVRVYLAACKHNQGDPQGAMTELLEALRLEPEHGPAKSLLRELSKRGSAPS
jgi:tetratricopeptide (TPR) repeat protein